MANAEHVEIVKQGTDAIREWREKNPDVRLDLSEAYLSGAYLSGASLSGADLSEANLGRANLSEANLREANLREANLGRADLRGANLSVANLREADLREANLREANLREANLREANLGRADLRGANLSGANLSGANLGRADLGRADLSGANLVGANLVGANLSGASLANADLTQADLSEATLRKADLTRARCIRSNLTEADVEDACVQDVHIQDLTGLPKSPSQLRLDPEGARTLKGEEAASFFQMPAIVEVYLTQRLSQQELGVYHFHIGELHHDNVGTGVFLVGFRCQDDKTVLRFQATTHQEIYDVLADLLAPFPLREAIDWDQTIKLMRPGEREDAATSLVRAQTKRAPGRWRFAERMAQVFNGYRNARVYQIKEGGAKGFRLDIYTNETMAKKLSMIALSDETFLIDAKGGTVYMGDQYSIHGDITGSIVGSQDSVNTGDITAFKQVVERSSLDEIGKAVLIQAREALEEADLTEADRTDAADALGKLTDELQKPEPSAARIQRAWTTIQSIVSAVGSMLKSADIIGKWLA